MINPIALSVKLGGLVVAGLALSAGWHLGNYIADVATGEKTVEWPSFENVFGPTEAQEPLWKRKFDPIR
jgi:hypothetical protein